MARNSQRLSILLSLISIAVPAACAFEADFAGSWVTTVNKPGGAWEVNWDVGPDGSYRTTYKTLKGAVNIPDEYGKLQTDGKTWHVNTTKGRTDGGQIELHGNTLVTIGGFGRTTWTRASAPTPPQVKAAMTPTPTPTTAPATTPLRDAPADYFALLSEARYMKLTAAKPGLANGLSAPQLFSEGLALKGNGRYADAAAKFSQALSANPGMIDAHMERGVCLTHMDSQSRPEILLRALPYAITGGANIYHLAIGDFTHVISSQPNNAKAWCMRGLAKAHIMAFGSAIQDYDRAIAINPKYAVAYANRGIAKIHAQPAAANADFQRAYSIDAKLKPTFDQMAVEARALSADLAAARQRARQAALQAPTGGFNDAAWDAADRANLRDREDRIERGVDSNPSNSNTHYSR